MSQAGGAAPALPRRATAALYGAFVLSGAVTVVLGPLVPELQARWGMPQSEAARLFLAQFAASSTGAILSGRNLRRSLVLGYALVALGLVLLVGGGRLAALPAMALVGLGLGLSIPSTNLVVAYAHPEARGAALSRINMVWGLGALGSPLLFAAVGGRAPAQGAPIVLAAAAAAASLWLARSLPPIETSAEPVQTLRRSDRRWPLVALLMVELFVYVGIETSIGGWVVALARQMGGRETIVPLLIGSGFWAAFLAGRAVTPLLLRHLAEPTLARVALAVAALGAGTLLLGPSTAMLAVGAALAGLGLAPLFPLIVSSVASRTPAAHSRGRGAFFAAANLGAAVFPWLTGRLGDRLGALQPAFVVPALGSAVLAVLFGLEHLASLRGNEPAAIVSALPRAAGD